MRFEVILTARAQRDLDDARDFIAQHAPETAERWRIAFLEALLALEQNPHSRPLAVENADFPFDLREFLYRTRSGRVNRALFTVVGNEVRVLAIRRPGQLPISAADLQ